MPPVTSTEITSLADNGKDGPFNESKTSIRVLVEKMDFGNYVKEEKNYEETDSDMKPKKKLVKVIPDLKRKRQILSEDSEDSEYEVFKAGRRRNAVRSTRKVNVQAKTIKNEKQVKENDSDEFEDEKPVKESDSEESDDEAVGMSAYEKMIQKKKRESMAFLQSLKINEVKAGLSEVVNTIKRKTPKPIKSVRTKKTVTELLPQRKSRRLANLAVDYSENSLFEKAVVEAGKVNYYTEPISSEMSFKDALKSEEMYENFSKDVRIQDLNPGKKPILYDNSIFKKLTLKDSNVAKVVPERITSLAWHPSADHLILAAGSKIGNIGIWNVNSDSNPHLFKVHNEGTTLVQFNPFNPVEMFSSSYEGTLRCGDMIQSMFTEVFNISEETSCSYFDFLTATTYLVGLRNGEIALVDRKTRKNSEMKHDCHNYAVKTVNIHPVNRNVFVTAENKGSVRLWDLRKLQKEPIADITHHKRCVNSAYFSSVTGNSLLTTSFDDTICIFDSTNLTQDIKLMRSMRHNNQTGRWLSFFRATWLPNSDDIFVVGSLQDPPRRIQLYSKDLNIAHLFMHENLTTITSCNAFHPFVPSLAGANSSGKVFVFT